MIPVLLHNELKYGLFMATPFIPSTGKRIICCIDAYNTAYNTVLVHRIATEIRTWLIKDFESIYIS